MVQAAAFLIVSKLRGANADRKFAITPRIGDARKEYARWFIEKFVAFVGFFS
jgi:hypothetical protein